MSTTTEGVELVGRLGVTWEEGEHLDYATIAKAGGRSDLLYHYEAAQSNKQMLPPPAPSMVDWFAHPETPPERQTTEYVSPLKGHWCQWDTTITKLPEIAKKGDKMSQTYPPVSSRDDVNFARLLTLDYQREWLQKRQDKQEKLKKLARERKLAQLKKIHDHSVRGQKQVEPSDSKDRFIMNRFKSIPSRVKLPPIKSSTNI